MGRPAIDLTSKRFGRLVVIERDFSYPSGTGKSAYWKCQCDCGNTISVRQDKLKNGITQSCGCLSKEVRTKIFLKDLTGQRFGKLVVLSRDTKKKMGKGQFAYWVCKCDCGNIVSVRGDHLRDKTTTSCGCLNSSGELAISKILQNNKISFQTQYTFDDLKGDYHNLRFDFAIFNKNNKLLGLIEFQGSQHYKKWGNETLERFNKRQEYDNKKREYCQSHNIKLLEISYLEQSELSWQYLKDKIKKEWRVAL